MPSFVYVLAATNPDARSTRGRNWMLVYAEKHRTRKGAMRREVLLKKDRKFRAALRGLP